MYIDAIDPVRTSQSQHSLEKCIQYGIQGETTLLKTLLEGRKPTLTQTQIIDSRVIHNIMESEDKQRAAFLDLISNNQIQVAMYPNLRENKTLSLTNYFLQTLQKGLKADESFHHYSSLHFMQELEDDVRKAFQKNMIDAITHNHYHFHVDGVPKEQSEYMQLFVHHLSLLDFELRGNFVPMGPFRKDFDSLVKEGCQFFIDSPKLDEDVHLLCRSILKNNHFSNTRSIYYDFLEKYADASEQSKELVKQLIDISYNESVASALPSHDCSLSIYQHFQGLIEHAERGSGPLTKEEILLISRKEDHYFTWESIQAFFYEVNRIQQEKNWSRLEAITHYQKQFSIHKPIMKVAKYLTLGLAPSIIPFGGAIADPIIEVFSKSAELVVGDALGDALKRPSIQDVTAELAYMKEQKVIAEKAYSFTLLTKSI